MTEDVVIFRLILLPLAEESLCGSCPITVHHCTAEVRSQHTPREEVLCLEWRLHPGPPTADLGLLDRLPTFSCSCDPPPLPPEEAGDLIQFFHHKSESLFSSMHYEY